MIRTMTSDEEAIVEPPDREMSDVTGYVMYASDFDIFLKRAFKGQTIQHLATVLGVPEEHVPKYLNGDWGPSKKIAERLRLKSVYALSCKETTMQPPDAA